MKEIFERRSIRKYTSQPVAKDTVERLLKAGMAAPSAHNEQPWQFIVIDDRELLAQIPEVHDYSSMLKEAPLAILVAGDKRCLQAEEEKLALAYMNQDCSAAIQNILLAAEGEGLGAVWLGVYPKTDVMSQLKDMFDLPEAVVPISLIAVGHPKEEKEGHDRYLADRVHWNQFNK